MTSSRRKNHQLPLTGELRETAKTAGRQLGQTVEDLTAQTGLRSRAKEVQETARHTVAQAAHAVQGAAAQSQPVLDKSAAVASGIADRTTTLAAKARAAAPQQVSDAAEEAGAVVRRRPKAVIAAAVGAVVLLVAALVRRGRR
jgi:hypothetical protein